MIRFFNIKLLSFITAVVFGVALSACRDDLLYDNSIIGDGEASISATVSFIPMGTGLDTRSSGTAIKEINSLCVLVYTLDGNLFDTYTSTTAGEMVDYSCTQDGNTDYPSDAPTGTGLDHASESKTPKATFKISNLPYGKYHIYAVANLGDLSTNDTEFETTDGETTKTTTIKDAIQTEAGLKGIKVEWNENNIAANKAMFGFFTPANKPTSIGFNAPELVINNANIDLHCWIKRTVSKVTIAFDPSGLKEAVSVYIKSVTIHDIPNTCYLGENNTPDNKEQLIADGETVYYGDGATSDSYGGWLRLQKGSGVQGSKDHLETDDALYFFENMQGDYENNPNKKDFLKYQIADETGTSISAPEMDESTGQVLTNENGNMKTDFKDRVPYGTYIEVEGYYVSQNKEKLSKGPIKYRFMLGKNTTYNYDAERNYHYKLTLKFRGWANEADWHIVYDEVSPTIYVPDPYYISYLYGQSMTLPVRITGISELKNCKLHAQIIENNWAPSILNEDGTTELAPEITGAYDDFEGMAWNRWAYDHTYMENGKPVNYAGFLSLRKDTLTIVGPNHTYGEAGDEYLYRNYLGQEADSPRFFADYMLDNIGEGFIINPEKGGEKNGTYNVIDMGDNSVTVELPMFTRPKELIPSSDFTGNNTFSAFIRQAVVRFSLRLKTDPDPKADEYSDANDIEFDIIHADGEKERVKYVDIRIYQVPRIVNPKAIWRKHNSTEAFHVELMQLDKVGGSKFETFESDGPWRVSIYRDPNGLIKLTGNGEEVTTTGKYIHGESGTSIDFNYQPNGTCGEKEARCGIILVEYNNYTCHHLIFVRQGYDKGMELGGNLWSCYNAFASGSEKGYNNNGTIEPDTRTTADVVVTNSPLSMGSLFKRNQYNYAILESNDKDYGWLQSITDKNLSTAYVDGTGYKTRDAKWSSFGGFAWNNYGNTESRFDRSWADTWVAVNKGNLELAVPTFEDYGELRDKTQYGYGVVYGDGATGVATIAADAFGYTDYDNDANAGSGSPKGVRACIVYDDKTGDQIIFPLGALGQGRRTCNALANTWNSTYNGKELTSFADPGYGSITYSRMRSLLYSKNGDANSNNHRPLTYNIYRQPGAVYWFKQPANKTAESSSSADLRVAGWDINYYTLVFNPYDVSTMGDGYISGKDAYNKSSDALPIKFIYKNKNKNKNNP